MIPRFQNRVFSAGVAGQLKSAARGGVHDVDVVIAGGAAPAKGEELAIGRPGGVNNVAHVRKIELLGIGAIGIHEVKLRGSSAITDEGDELAVFRIPCGGSVCAIGSESEALGTIAAGVGNVEGRIALHG